MDGPWFLRQLLTVSALHVPFTDLLFLPLLSLFKRGCSPFVESVNLGLSRKRPKHHDNTTKMFAPISTCSVLRQVRLQWLVLLAIVTNQLALGAPIEDKSDDKSDDPVSKVLDHYTVSAPAAIAGAILVVSGFFLCFASTLNTRYKKVSTFLIGFFFFGNITYITMANLGVDSSTWLLVGPLLSGTILGSARMKLRRPGAESLGPMAMHCFSLWLLSVKPGGLITSRPRQIGLIVGLNAIGPIFLLLPTDFYAAVVGFSMLGAFTFVVGTDFFAQTGFNQEIDTFINSKCEYDASDRSIDIHYALVGLTIVIAIAGIVIQLKWGEQGFCFEKK